MEIKSNAHVHTRFCDGRDSVETMVLEAIRRGFVSLGFSIHGWNPYDRDWLSMDREDAYRAEVRRVREKYAGQIEILMGAERDALYPRDYSAFEYLIDSTHWFIKDGVPMCVDQSEARMLDQVKTGFGGDFYAYARAYFEREAEMCASSNAAFIGHIDLVCKFNEGNRHFDERDPRYLGPALEAARCALERGRPIEINTGAIARGYRSAPYPAEPILRYIRAHGGEVIINGDSHNADSLEAAYDLARASAAACGFDHVLRLRAGGFEEVPLA